MNLSENEVLGLSGKNWEPLPRISRTIPFGYKVEEDNPKTLIPVLLELEALEKARKYHHAGYSLRDCADWLSDVTGRKISHLGLRKRFQDDRSKRSKAATLRRWATAYKEAILEAQEWDRKKGNDLSTYDDLYSWIKSGKAED